MKKFILGGLAATAAIATSLAVAGSASAVGTPRCQESVAIDTGTTTATFKVISPANEYGQWANLWTWDYTVTVQPDGSFEGKGVLNGWDANGAVSGSEQTITGEFTDSDDADTLSDHVNLTSIRTSDNVAYTLTNAALGTIGTENVDTAVITQGEATIETPQPVQVRPEFGGVGCAGVG